MRAAAIVLVLVAVGRVAAALGDLRYENERVTARFEHVPVADAVAALAGATGAELHGGIISTREVTLVLDAVPVEEALHRLLGGQNFTVSYADGGRVTRIVLRGGPEAPAPPPAGSPAAGAAPEPAKPGFPVVLGRMFDRHRPIDIPEPLAKEVGANKLGMPELLQMAMADENGINRALATNVVLTALEREARYRRAFLRSLHRLDPEELAGIATGPDGARFEEILEFLAAHSREPTLQKKAGVVLDQLREARDGASG